MKLGKGKQQWLEDKLLTVVCRNIRKAWRFKCLDKSRTKIDKSVPNRMELSNFQNKVTHAWWVACHNINININYLLVMSWVRCWEEAGPKERNNPIEFSVLFPIWPLINFSSNIGYPWQNSIEERTKFKIWIEAFDIVVATLKCPLR